MKTGHRMLRGFVGLSFFLLAIALAPGPSWADFAMFVKVEGIPGESTDVNHKDWIDAFGYEESITLPERTAIFGGGAGRTDFSPIKLFKYVDKASPKLLRAAVMGQHIPKVVIEVVTKGEVQQLIWRIELTNVFLSEMTTKALPDKLGAITTLNELVAFSYERIRWTYFSYDLKGAPLPPVIADWDLLRNREF